MWKKNKYRFDFGSLITHINRCITSDAFKNIYPTGLSLWNFLLTKRIDFGVVDRIRNIDGVSQVIPSIGGYNMVVEIPSTFREQTVITICVMEILQYYEGALQKVKEDPFTSPEGTPQERKPTVQ